MRISNWLSLASTALLSLAACIAVASEKSFLPLDRIQLPSGFYDGDAFPDEYRNRLFVAEHRSWDRSTPIGYRISVLTFDGNGKSIAYEVFADGWLDADGSYWGRPTDLLVVDDGTLLISDDFAGVIYRISYRTP